MATATIADWFKINNAFIRYATSEVSYTAWPNLFPDQPLPRTLRSLQKFEKVPCDPK